MSSVILSDALRKSISLLQEQLRPFQGDWLIGGSCGLLLQQVSLSKDPKDLDIYTDHRFVEPIAEQLSAFAVDQPQYSETSRYRSYLSHYVIEGVTIELVGEFVVECGGSTYRVEVSDLMNKYRYDAHLDGMTLGIMPLAHEFVFNIMREREDRYVPIAEKIASQPEIYFPAFYEILKRNSFSEQHLQLMMDMLKLSKSEREQLMQRITVRSIKG